MISSQASSMSSRNDQKLTISTTSWAGHAACPWTPLPTALVSMVSRLAASGRKEPSADMPAPDAHESGPLGRFRPSAPHFSRRMAVQVLMRPRMVVPSPKLYQFHPQVIAILNGDAVERPLERAEKPLHPSVLPRAMQRRGLQTNAQAPQRRFQ